MATVKDLRQLLDNLSDDMPVLIDLACLSYAYRLDNHFAGVSPIFSVTENGLSVAALEIAKCTRPHCQQPMYESYLCAFHLNSPYKP